MVMREKFRNLLAVGVVAGLAACGGGGGGSADSASIVTPTPTPTPSTPVSATLSGLAATGAAIANAAVTAKCVTGPLLTGNTNLNGAFTLTLSSAHTAPCMLQVTGGTPSVTLHSFAAAAGQVNISPLTDLVVAKALGDDPVAAFATFDSTKGSTINAGLVAAKAYVQTQVSSITGSGTADPLTSTFAVGSADDKVLDALGAALVSAGKGIDDLRVAAKGGKPLAAITPAFLGAPTSTAATANGPSQITLNWNAVPGASGYNVYSSAAPAVQIVSGNKLTANPVSAAGGYVASGLNASTAYYFKVTAINSVAPESAPSAEVTASTSAVSVTAAPSGVSATANSGTQITINWSGVSGATGYNVYRASSSGGALTQVNTTAVTSAVAFVDTGLTASTAYFYKVKAINASGESAASAEATATTSAASSALSITSFSGTSGLVSGGKVGDVFYVVGTGFELNNVSATFTGNVTGTVFFLNGTMFTLTVPTGAQTGPITFRNLTSGASVQSGTFTITTPPVIPAQCTGNSVVTTLPATGVVGVNWSDCRDQSPGDVQVVWGANMFVAAGKGVASSVMKSSTNGYTWTASPSGKNFDKIAFNGTRWIGLISNALTVQISYSADSTLDSWTVVPINLNLPGTLQNAFAVNGRFFVGTNNGSFLTSTDGISWTETANGLCGQSSLSASYAGSISRVVYFNAKYLMYVSGAQACTSTDGITWTASALTFSPASNGGGGRSGVTLVSYPFTPTAYAWNGSKFVTSQWSDGTSGSNVWSSTDGLAWTKESGLAPFQVQVKDMVWTGSRFVALGAALNGANTNVADAIASSADGITWTAAPITGLSGTQLRYFAYSPTMDRLLTTGFINSSRNALYVSP
jgi:hypothetical protein